jgi:hypothetical protein
MKCFEAVMLTAFGVEVGRHRPATAQRMVVVEGDAVVEISAPR